VRRWAALGAIAALAGCAPPPLEEPRALSPPPAAVTQAPPLPMTPLPAPRDSCGAAEVQGLVGHPRTEIPVPIEPNRQRVACTTCPVTQDYRPERLNFYFDAQTGLIREIKCG
jgi:hypothetical protein